MIIEYERRGEPYPVARAIRKFKEEHLNPFVNEYGMEEELLELTDHYIEIKSDNGIEKIPLAIISQPYAVTVQGLFGYKELDLVMKGDSREVFSIMFDSLGGCLVLKNPLGGELWSCIEDLYPGAESITQL